MQALEGGHGLFLDKRGLVAGGPWLFRSCLGDENHSAFVDMLAMPISGLSETQ